MNLALSAKGFQVEETIGIGNFGTVRYETQDCR